MCGNEICNILEEYEGQISSDLENKAKFYNSDISSSHIVDITLGKDNASEIDTPKEEMKIFCGRIWAIKLNKEKLFVMFQNQKAVQNVTFWSA
jgi:uncharacterized protein YecE (DUF72 family)